jgi:2-amino-4-hydroxy-6-hydroxymethyldihydropteridine diphosphokinase
VAIGLGSNLGDRLGHLVAALTDLDRLLEGLRVAPLFRTPPMRRSTGAVPADWPDFLNTAATGRSRLRPDQLLAELKRLELGAGRRRAERDAPRPLDLDLLLYDELVIDGPELALPHPRLSQRLFVLAPLAAIAPDWPVPPAMTPVAALFERRRGSQPVERVDWPGGDWRPHC